MKWLLDEIDGDLYYRGVRLGPVPDEPSWSGFREAAQPPWMWGGAGARWLEHGYLSADQLHDVMGDRCTWTAIWRCIVCHRWVVGYDAGCMFCSPRCHRAFGTQGNEHRRRQQLKKGDLQTGCAECGTPIEAKLGTRKFCSDRCRQRSSRRDRRLRNRAEEPTARRRPAGRSAPSPRGSLTP
jgi:endogenous inhibitor of DNA gyrase (YacG/DUF329 family)